jgi:DNA-binding GntR family transcriptional regulator
VYPASIVSKSQAPVFNVEHVDDAVSGSHTSPTVAGGAPTVSYRPLPLTKSTYAYNELRRQIVCGELAPGERLDLNQLCDALQISRMPIREALSRLEEQGLVEIRPQAATVVSTLSVADLLDTYGARVALEALLAGAAAPHVDAELLDEMARDLERQRECAANDLGRFLVYDRRFHDRLYQRAGMARSQALVERLRDVADRYIYKFLENHTRRWESIAEHEQLLERCRRRDAEAVRATITAHIEGGRDVLLVELERAEHDDEEPSGR